MKTYVIKVNDEMSDSKNNPAPTGWSFSFSKPLPADLASLLNDYKKNKTELFEILKNARKLHTSTNADGTREYYVDLMPYELANALKTLGIDTKAINSFITGTSHFTNGAMSFYTPAHDVKTNTGTTTLDINAIKADTKYIDDLLMNTSTKIQNLLNTAWNAEQKLISKYDLDQEVGSYIPKDKGYDKATEDALYDLGDAMIDDTNFPKDVMELAYYTKHVGFKPI